MSSPKRRKKDWLKAYLDYTDNSEPPTLYKTWVGLSLIAACLQRKCYMPWAPTRLYCNMYVVLLGPPGEARKGTAMSPGQYLIKNVGIQTSSQAPTFEALIGEFKSAQQETNGEIHSSLTMFHSEIGVFLTQGGGSKKASDLFTALCQLYDCEDDWQKNTIARDKELVQGVWFNIIGAATPQGLRDTLTTSLINSGFSSRIIFVCARARSKWISPFDAMLDDEKAKNLIHDMSLMLNLSGCFQLTDQFKTNFATWYKEQCKNPPDFTARNFASYGSRRPTHLAKLCMLLSASTDDNMLIHEGHLERAIEILTEVEVPMPFVFEGFGLHPLSGVQVDVIALIRRESLKHQDGKIPISIVANEFAGDIDIAQLQVLLATMVERRLITVAKNKISGEKYIQFIQKEGI